MFVHQSGNSEVLTNEVGAMHVDVSRTEWQQIKRLAIVQERLDSVQRYLRLLVCCICQQIC